MKPKPVIIQENLKSLMPLYCVCTPRGVILSLLAQALPTPPIPALPVSHWASDPLLMPFSFFGMLPSFPKSPSFSFKNFPIG